MDADPAILERLELLKAKGIHVEVVTKTEAEKHIHLIRNRIAATDQRSRKNVSRLHRNSIIKWLCDLPIRPETNVLVLWPHYRTGARLGWDDFADMHDELWRPSADDVWIVEREGGWILELDHEERFTYYAKSR